MRRLGAGFRLGSVSTDRAVALTIWKGWVRLLSHRRGIVDGWCGEPLFDRNRRRRPGCVGGSISARDRGGVYQRQVLRLYGAERHAVGGGDRGMVRLNVPLLNEPLGGPESRHSTPVPS